MYIDINKLDINQMSFDFNISKRFTIQSINNYNKRYGYKYSIRGYNLKMIPDKHKNRYFYHFTHIENLKSILINGFLSTNKKEISGIFHKSIANESIQNRRHDMDVTCHPKGKVHDYVPFYFATTNPMLLGIVNRKNIDQLFMIFFAVSIDKLLEDNVVFTDASANTNIPPNFYNNPNDLNKLNWEAIDKTSWGSKDDDERHQRMAEVLIYDETPLDWIDTIIVWNESIKEFIEGIYKESGVKLPNITYQPFNGRCFYFTKFALGRKNETLVTGPYLLKNKFNTLIKTIVENRTSNLSNPKFKNIHDVIQKIETNFCCIDELAGIYKLETVNEVHSENVSDHTKKVVQNLMQNDYYNALSNQDKDIAKLSAYLHDIGKGPKSKWSNGKQKAYADHPADAIPMLERILSEDILELSEYEIRKICLLVIYHDLIGDIIGQGRSKEELMTLIEDENELNMLISISLADVSAINTSWLCDIIDELPNLEKEILEYLNKQ